MRLSGAIVTRIEEELARLERNGESPSRWCPRSRGDRHRAIEDFVEALVGMGVVKQEERKCVGQS